MRYKYIVAIDFGTSRSGFAWAHYGEVSGMISINKRSDWPGIPSQYPKTYSDLYYDSDSAKWYFGGDAVKIRHYSQDISGAHVNFNPKYYYREYKMMLYDEKWASNNVTTKKEARNLIQQELCFLKDSAVDSIMKVVGSGASFSQSELVDSILWVVTVPEGASDDAKAIMRQAAIDAGLIKPGTEDFDRLVFALEPEAAMIAAIADYQSDFNDRDTVIIYDAGGGTVDVSVRKLERNGDSYRFQAIDSVLGSCSPSGSSYMDKRFAEYLSDIFGAGAVENLLLSHNTHNRDDYYQVIEDFRRIKESTSQNEYIFNIDVQCLWESLEAVSPQDFEAIKLEMELNDGALSRNGIESRFVGRKSKYLQVNQQWFETVFCDYLHDAYLPLKSVIESLRSVGERNLIVYFVGGCSCFPILREYIKKSIARDYPETKSRAFIKGQSIRFVEVEPFKMCSEVLNGAVLYGQDPEIIASRISKLTYGTESYYNGDEHYFSIFVKKGERVSFKKPKELSYYPVEPNQTKVRFQIFSTDSNRTITDSRDSALTKLEDIMVDSPDTRKGTNREIKVILQFGGTETVVTIRDEETKNEKKVSLHIPFDLDRN